MDSQLPVYLRIFLTHGLNKQWVFLCLLIACFCLRPEICQAGEMDFDAFGLSYHFSKKGADPRAPLKLDNAGKWVFNPGLGAGYDFRKDIHTPGWAPIIHGGFFETCANHPFTFAGAGARYRKFFFKKFFWETDIMGVLTYGNDWDNKNYRLVPMPYANLGLGYDLGKELVTFSISYIPKDSGNSVTSGTSMLFMNMSVAF